MKQLNLKHPGYSIMRSRRSTAALIAAAVLAAIPSASRAQDVSAPAILQMFEATYKTMERRAPDMFMAGYGGLWTPPPGRADQGNVSVGYDVYDRFDLGSAGNYTLYGSETGLKTTVHEIHKIGASVYSDLVWNHSGFSDSASIDDKGTPSTSDDVSFVQAGSYPGLAVSLPGDGDGDFHGAFESGQFNGRIPGINLIDIAQEKNHQYIRNPVPGFANNLPAGTDSAFGRIANVPTEANRRFYPDLEGPSTTINGVTYYKWNTASPSTGDPVLENATGYLMRQARWMVEVIGVDGFRLDATKHMINPADGNPDWVLEFYDQAVNGAISTPLLDGSQKRVFGFGEYLDANTGLVQQSIKKDANANRDALDFAMHYALRDNLTNNGFANDWRNIVNTTQDAQDGFANNGSQGVSFDASHDEGGAYLGNVANAYLLMRPGNSVVYFNAKEFGTGRSFPKDGRGDALGGFYGDAITKLVNIRNAYGRGNYQERWIDKETLVYEREKSAVAGYSNRLDEGLDPRTVQTSFAPGTHLIELTGNATDLTVDPNQAIDGGDIYDVVTVNGSGQITINIPRNKNINGVEHDKGYVIYGPATPRGTLSFTNVARTLAGETATAANNGTVRLTSIDIIKANSFDVNLQTNPVILPDGFNDLDAAGDAALVRFDGGLNINGNAGVDVVNPGDISYGFENFLTKSSPKFGGGDGEYIQSVDASQLSEGYHYVTARAYRHRNPDTGGDGGPAVFTDFRKVVYVDRLRPVSAIDSLLAINGGGGGDRDVVVKSTDKTATGMAVFANIGANEFTDAQLTSMAASGSNPASSYDRDLFKYGVFGLKNGNQAFTVVTFEMTYDPSLGYAGGGVSVQRFSGIGFTTGGGMGLGDLDFNSTLAPADVNSFSGVLATNNTSFNPAGDLNADGLIDEPDNVLMVPWITFKSANAGTITTATNLRLARAIALDGTLSIPSGSLNVSGTAVTGMPLTFTNSFNLPANRTITKTGGQTLNINGPQTHGINSILAIAEGAANINTDGGTNLTVNTSAGAATSFGVTQHLKSLGVSGNVTLAANGPATSAGGRVLVTKTLNVTGGKLDLANNNLVVDYTGTSVLNDLTAQIIQGRNDGAWNGATGILSSSAATQNGLTGLGIADAGELLSLDPTDTTIWSGQTVDGSSVLVKYTYVGDANLDGLIDGTDYFYIDNNVGTSADGYANGDFNYDGVIDGTDYFYIDSNIVSQGAPLLTSTTSSLEGLAIVAIPEPSAAMLLLTGASLLARRRRVHHTQAQGHKSTAMIPRNRRFT